MTSFNEKSEVPREEKIILTKKVDALMGAGVASF